MIRQSLLLLVFLGSASCSSDGAADRGTLARETAVELPSQDRPTEVKEVDALESLRAAEPGILWDSATAIVGYFDGDDIGDFAAVGTKPDSAFLGVISGSAANRARVIRFVRDGARQDGVCAGPLALSTERLDSAMIMEFGQGSDTSWIGTPSEEARGLRFGSDDCDAFHIYWDPNVYDFVWWRL